MSERVEVERVRESVEVETMSKWKRIEKYVFVAITTPAMLIGMCVHLTKRGYQVGILLVESWIAQL